MIGVREPQPTGYGRNPRGFTLMEMLVALGIFSVVMAAATDIYLMAGRGQRKAFNLEKVQSDARFTMEAVTREVRTGVIDYGYYATRDKPFGLPEEDLALVSSDNTRIRFFKSDDSNKIYCPDNESIPCLLVKVGNSNPASITPKGVSVMNLKFYIAPLADPYYYDTGIGDYGSDTQPHVTTILYVKNAGGRLVEQSTVYLQTTVSSRVYRR